MNTRFEEFLVPLKDTQFTLGDYVDFKKVEENVQSVSVKLNTLNYLVGKADIGEAVKEVWRLCPDAFSVLSLLVAVRQGEKKKYLDEKGCTHLITDCYTSPEGVTEYLCKTGLAELLSSAQVTNLVDYVFGVEVGLDSNARKNRSGHLMERLVAEQFNRRGVKFRREVSSTEFPAIAEALGSDKKRFDFVVCTDAITYLIEVNFYAGGGSKPKEVARAYTELAPRINAVPGFEFVWITDGIGWRSARKMLEEAFANIPKVYNLTTLTNFIDLVQG